MNDSLVGSHIAERYGVVGVAGGIGGIHRVDIDGNPRADVGEEGCGSHLRNLLRNWGK